MIRFETERLILRNDTMDDVPEVHAYFSSEEVVRHLTEDLHVKEIYGNCDERNTASAKLLERPGFRLMEIVDDAYKDDADGNPIVIRSKEYKLAV